ncbi:MAG: T9SS type A sorting domain-containing protein [Ignavibacteria bacterium]|nr:T9SS type A sorting domain-containing protein [Ignavibacteria bacterium]
MQILFLLGISVSVFPFSNSDNFKVTIPEFIPKGKPFEVMLTTSKAFEDADELDVYLITDNSLFLKKAELWTKEGKSDLKISSVFLKEFSTTAYNISIDFNSENFSEIDKYFQILIGFGPLNLEQASIKLYAEFKKDDKIIGYFESTNKNIYSSEDEKLFDYSVSSFEKFPIADKNVLFNPNSSLKIPLNYNSDINFVIDFWVKHSSFGNSLLYLFDEQAGKVELSLDLSEFQMMSVSSIFHEISSLKPAFISNKAWYHIVILISSTEPSIYFYCNDEEISKVKLLYDLNFENLFLKFDNSLIVPSSHLEQIRLFNLTGSIKSILRNKNFKDFTSAGVKLLFQMNFINSELNSLKNSERISFENLELVNSDAPIFPRAPKLNLKVLNNFYEIEWTGGDYTNVSHYVLERAVGDDIFIKIAQQDAERKTEKVYTQLTEKSDQPEIVYYRIKQINLDKSEVYSEIAKVGQGIVEDVILEQNYPNPFNPKTQIEFELLQDGEVEAVVYNLAGSEVALLHKGFLSQGTYKFEFDGSELPSGIYLFQVVTLQSTQTRKMILAK